MLIQMTRLFPIRRKLCKRLLTDLRDHVQNMTLVLIASSSRQLLIAVATHFLFLIIHSYDTQCTPYLFSS